MNSTALRNPEIEKQFASDRERKLAYDAIAKVLNVLKQRGETKEEVDGDDGGSWGYIIDTNLPEGFSYARVALEGTKLLHILKQNGLLGDQESAEKFLFTFIGYQRGIF